MATYAERMQSHITALLAGNGNFGTKFINAATGLVTAKINSVTVIEACVFKNTTVLLSGSTVSNSVIYPAGVTIVGTFTAIEMTSGSVQVTIAEPQ